MQEEYYEQRFLDSVARQIGQVPTKLRNQARLGRCCMTPPPPDPQNPVMVSIGPNYYGQPHLEAIQQHKWRFLSEFQSLGIQPVQLYRMIAEKESVIRDFYFHTLPYNRAELAEIMTLDGCFIVYLMSKMQSVGVLQNEDETLIELEDVRVNVRNDFLRLENQIPFVVVDSIYQLLRPLIEHPIPTNEHSPPPSRFTEIALKYFSSRDIQFNHHEIHNQTEHLLELIHSQLIINMPPDQNELAIEDEVLLHAVHSITKLAETGIVPESRFTIRAPNLLRIRFTPRVGAGALFRRPRLEIPVIFMDNYLTTILMNCAKYERHCSRTTKHVTSYLAFMSSLVNKSEDVTLMKHRGLMERYTGTDEQVCEFFHGSVHNAHLTMRESYLKYVMIEINRYSRSRFKVVIGGFKYMYFGEPPRMAISAIGFSLMLLLTWIQVLLAAAAK